MLARDGRPDGGGKKRRGYILSPWQRMRNFRRVHLGLGKEFVIVIVIVVS